MRVPAAQSNFTLSEILTFPSKSYHHDLKGFAPVLVCSEAGFRKESHELGGRDPTFRDNLPEGDLA